MSDTFSANHLPVEKYYILNGCFRFSCKNPKEQYVFDESEVNSSKIQKYIKYHKIDKYHKIYAQRFELKKWGIDDVIKLKEVYGWTPDRILTDNGFKHLAQIDLSDLFGDLLYQWTGFRNGKSYTTKVKSESRYYAVYDLVEKKKEIQIILDTLGYKNKNLIIYRTSCRKGWYGSWDYIDVFEKSNARKPKIFYRLKINLTLVHERITSRIRLIKYCTSQNTFVVFLSRRLTRK